MVKWGSVQSSLLTAGELGSPSGWGSLKALGLHHWHITGTDGGKGRGLRG